MPAGVCSFAWPQTIGTNGVDVQPVGPNSQSYHHARSRLPSSAQSEPATPLKGALAAPSPRGAWEVSPSLKGAPSAPVSAPLSGDPSVSNREASAPDEPPSAPSPPSGATRTDGVAASAPPSPGSSTDEPLASSPLTPSAMEGPPSPPPSDAGPFADATHAPQARAQRLRIRLAARLCIGGMRPHPPRLGIWKRRGGTTKA